MVPGSRFGLSQNNGLAVWGVAIRVRPCVFPRSPRPGVGQAFARDQPLKSRQPVFVVTRAIVGLTPIRRCLQFLSKRGGPFLPGEVAFSRKPHREPKRLSLPWLGKRGSLVVARRRWYGLQVRRAQDSYPIDQGIQNLGAKRSRPTTPAPGNTRNRGAAAALPGNARSCPGKRISRDGVRSLLPDLSRNAAGACDLWG